MGHQLQRVFYSISDAPSPANVIFTYLFGFMRKHAGSIGTLSHRIPCSTAGTVGKSWENRLETSSVTTRVHIKQTLSDLSAIGILP